MLLWLSWREGLALLALLQLWRGANAQDCLQGALTTRTAIPFEDLRENDDVDPTRLPSDSQAIVTSYQFHCCGEITEWQTYMQPGGGNHDGVYTVRFQVWRPYPVPDGGSYYSMVGENIFPTVSLSSRQVMETPRSRSVISVRPGDVLGYFVSGGEPGRNEGIQMHPDFTEDEVVYATLGENPLFSPGACPIVSVGPGGLLSSTVNAAPVFSIQISSSDCPPAPMLSICSSLFPTPTPTPEPSTNTPTDPPTDPPTNPPTDLPTDPPTNPPTDSPTNPPTNPPTDSPTNPPTDPPTDSASSDPSTDLPTNLPASSNSPQTGTDPSNIAPTATTQAATDGAGAVNANTEGPPTPITTRNPVNAGLVAGLIVVVIILIVSAVVVVVVLLLRRNTRTKKVKMDRATQGYNDLLNPNYEFVEEPENKKKKKPSRNSAQQGGNIQAPEYCSVDYAYASMKMESPYYSSADISTGKKPPLPSRKQREPSPYEIEMSIKGDEKYSYHTLGPEYGFPYLSGEKEGEEEPLYSDPVIKDIEESEGPVGQVVPSQRERIVKSTIPTKMNGYDKLNFFEDTNIYWAPGTTTSEIYDQLASKKYREISRDQILIQDKLGSGQFGQVSKGLWNVSKKSFPIAIKQLFSGASSNDRVKLLQEAAIMGQFSHPNVVKLYGLVTLGDPLMVCIEFMQHGDLRSFFESMDLSKDNKIDGHTDLRFFFLRASKEIAAGMKYLSRKSFVHRDLAARNILLNEDMICKVGDFGMARDLMDDTYYKSSGGKIPVKWTAPEALLYKKYSTDSDVWSYAMLLFEIWTVGKKPFPSMSNHTVLRIIESGVCQPPPTGCPRAIYRLMVDCWNPQHQYRPSFDGIFNYLEQPPSKLLYWSPSDSTLAPQVEELGAPLENSAKLYPDLQDRYNKAS